MKNISQKITHLNQIALECFDASSEKHIIRRFTDAGIKTLHAHFGFAWLKETNSSLLELGYKSPGTPYNPKAPRKAGASRKVMVKNQPMLISDYINSPYFRPDSKGYVKSLVVIPIYYKNQTYGSVFICFQKRVFFSKDDKTLCNFIGNSAAQAITFFRLHKKLKIHKINLEHKIRRRTSELEKINEHLAQDKASDEALLSSIGESIIATNKDAKIILINSQALELLSGKAADFLSKNIFEALPLWDDKKQPIPQEMRPTYLALNRGIKTQSSPGRHFFIKHAVDSAVPVSLTVTPIVFNGQITGAIEILRDITEERRIDKAKSELISLASHQLRTPLAAINWYSESILSGEIGRLNPEQKKYMRQIFEANHKMIELVYDFLNVSRIELGTFTLKVTRLNVQEVAQEVIRELEPAIRQKKLVITYKFGQGMNNLEMDRKILKIIFQNLCSNAVKYTNNRGKIRVEAKIEGEEFKISVADNGLGIPKNQQSKIFTKLFRADNIQKLDTEGTGLGLYILKSLVDFCHGQVSFKSIVGKGTEFKVCLPLTTFKTPLLNEAEDR